MTKLSAAPDPEEQGDQIDPYAPEVNAVSGLDASFKKEVVLVKEGRPRKDEFFRINPDPDFIHDYWLLIVDDGMTKENYLVMPGVRHLVADDVHPHRLFVGINRHNTMFVWPVRLYNDDEGTAAAGGGRSWSDSALECAEHAKSLWIKIKGNRSSGAYEYTAAQGSWEEPKWPDYSFRDLMEKAFKGKVVDRSDHPVIQKVFGER
jgi:hypothetical protein